VVGSIVLLHFTASVCASFKELEAYIGNGFRNSATYVLAARVDFRGLRTKTSSLHVRRLVAALHLSSVKHSVLKVFAPSAWR
jgi:hypothetical protein